MAPQPIPVAVAALTYPPYACAFDPEDAKTLIVGGGGGAGRNGVSNKLSVFSVEGPTTLKPTGELELSSAEDSVSSLAIGVHRSDRILAYAGVNSSPDDIANQKNEHFCVYGISATSSTEKEKTKDREIELLTRANVFPAKDTDLYQRVIRVAAPSATTQFAVVATGLAKTPKLAIVEMGRTAALEPKVIKLLNLQEEASDVDIRRIGPNDEHRVVYCDKNMVCSYVFTPGENGTADHRKLFVSPPKRGVVRGVRILTNNFVLLMTNFPGRKGVGLTVIRIPKNPAEFARVVLMDTLPSHVVQATALAVQMLGEEPKEGELLGRAQFAIAVAGHDASIPIYLLDHESSGESDVAYRLVHATTIKKAHPLQITSLAFAPFKKPEEGTDYNLSLASTSLGNTLSVHSLPVIKKVTKQSTSTKENYVLNYKTSDGVKGTFIMFVSFIILLLAVIGQVLNEAVGEGKEIFGVRKYMDNPFIGKSTLAPLPPVISTSTVPVITTSQDIVGATSAPEALAKFLENIQAESIDGPVLLTEQLVEVKEGENGQAVIAAVAAAGDHAGVSWEELAEAQKAEWKSRLVKAGHWAEDMGEAVFKGIVFGEIGRAVGRAVGEGLM